MGTYTKYDEEFKKMIVQLCETPYKSIAGIAREYGISRSRITNWIKKYGTNVTSTGAVDLNDYKNIKKQKKLHEKKNIG